MIVKKILAASFFVFSSLLSSGQDTWYGSTAGMKSMFNPAFSGAEGKTVLRLSSCSFMPGRGFGLNSLFASVDGFMPGLHGGASLWMTNDFMGEVTNDLRGGMTYAYHLKAGRNLFFNAGLTASVIHIGIDRSAIVFPDDIDPYSGMILPSDETYTGNGITRVDIGSGFSVASGDWYGGFAVMHLARPYMSERQDVENRLSYKYIIEGVTEITAGDGKTSFNPSAVMIIQDKWFMADAGFSVEREQLRAGLSVWYIKDGMTAIQPSIGWKGSLTSVSLTYAYNLSTPQYNLPSTALVRLSISYVLKNVEKRTPFHVIKFPEM